MSIITIVRGLSIRKGKPYKYFNIEFEGHVEWEECQAAVNDMLKETGAERATKLETIVQEIDDE